jgi:peptidoglycan/xylan/chitin deacetylase (PgdA/CDA1 family)
MKVTILVFVLCFSFLFGSGQNNAAWKGKKAAVVITYDDAINQHLDNAIPVLDSLGLKATFYITGFSASMQSRLNDWKKIAANGHELGNHTLYHPCKGGPGREWVRKEYDLDNYTVPRLVDEIRATNVLLQSMDGKTKRTFAFTCADTKVRDSSFGGLIQKDFVAMRNVRNAMHTIDKVDLSDVDCYMVNNHTAGQMIDWVKRAVETNSLLVILFHGVGGGNGLDVSIPAHREFLSYLKKNEKDIWVAPMIEVAEYIIRNQK